LSSGQRTARTDAPELEGGTRHAPTQANLTAQQRAFDAFRLEYNEERPHEALGGQTPSQIYVPSARDFPERLPDLKYPQSWETRQVRPSGQVKWKGQSIYVTKALIGERIGFEPVEDGVWMAHFATQPLGLFDERRGRIEPLRGLRKDRR
jgi:hypothetical protein